MVNNSDTQDFLYKQTHKDYRSGLRIILWLVKHSRPNIATSVSELSKVLDSPSKVSYKEMLQSINKNPGKLVHRVFISLFTCD